MSNKERLEECGGRGRRRALSARARPTALELTKRQAGCEANQRYAGLTRVRLIYSRAVAPSQGCVTTVYRCGTLLQAVAVRVRHLTFVLVLGRQRLAPPHPHPPGHQVEPIELVKQALFTNSGPVFET